MKVAYFFSTKEPLADGTSSQAITLCENADFFEPVSIQPLSGAEDEQFVGVPSDRLGEIKYPIPPAERRRNYLYRALRRWTPMRLWYTRWELTCWRK